MPISTFQKNARPQAKKSKVAKTRQAAVVKAKAAAKRLASRTRLAATRVRKFRCRQIYHVFQRGNFQRAVFLSDEEKAVYLNYFFSRARKYHVRVHNFCLMKNHVHFVLEQTRKHGISRLMRDLQGLHTRKQNARVGAIGNLWNQHFGCKLVESTSYYQALMWYVSNNPVKVGNVSTPTGYRWSGAVALTQGGQHTLYIPTSKGITQPVPIRLWIAKFNRECYPTKWAVTQAQQLATELLPHIEKIELILDGTARLYFANQERIRQLNALREARKSASTKQGRRGTRSELSSAESVERKTSKHSPPPRKAAGQG